MSESPPVQPAVDFNDRRAGLIGLGILVIIIGCVCALFVPLMMFGLTMSAKSTGQTVDYRTIIPAVMVYASLAVTFIWLGIGSILCRRWARALLLILSWAWMLSGVLMMVAMAFFLPTIFANASPGGQSLPEGTRIITMVVLVGFFGVVFVIVPGVLLLFYRSRHVKATCEARDPVVRWTDACPLPVLALSLLLAFGALSMVPMVLVYHGVMPVFGRLVSGLPGTALMVVLIVLYCYCTWAIYKLKSAGWWLTIVVFVLFMASAIVTYSRVDLVEMYRLMGYPQSTIEQMQQSRVFGGHNMVWFMTIAPLPFLGYLLYVKRYFRQPA